jgi:hypothetical protein
MCAAAALEVCVPNPVASALCNLSMHELTGDTMRADGTTVAYGAVDIIAWEEKKLREELDRDNKLAGNVSHVLVSSLVEQLLQRYKKEQEQAQEMEGRRKQQSQFSSRLSSQPTQRTLQSELEETRHRGFPLATHASSNELPMHPSAPPAGQAAAAQPVK